MPTREERERPIGRGKGGDITAALDEAAENVILKHFDLPDVRIVSEEIGIKGEGALTVCVDPIDGSQNAERAIPYFALCVAVAEGRTMDDVVFGFVHDFGSGEEWTAVRGGGAFLNGVPLTGRPKDEIQFLSIEATRADARLLPSSRSSRRSPTGFASWARRRSPSATSPPGARTPSSS